MGSEKFCLRWNDFESNISLAFRELREDKDFFDVTLACDDEQINAHKVILSACSPFFRNILRRNPHQHPLLYLKGIKLSDLQCVLNFMYHGEVSVAQEELNTFLAVAEDLKVKGLTQGKSATNTRSPKTQTIKPKSQISRDSNLPVKQVIKSPSIQSSNLSTLEDDDIQELVPVKAEPRDLPPSDQPQVTSLPTQQIYNTQPSQQASHAVTTADDPSYDYQAEGYDDYGQYEGGQMYGAQAGEEGEGAFDGNKDLFALLDVQIENLMVRSDDKIWQCSQCGKGSVFKNDIARHIEAAHLQNHPGIICDLCGEMVRTRNALRQHKNVKHKARTGRL